MAKRKVKLEVEVPDDEIDQAPAKAAKRPSRLRWLVSRLFVLLILLGGLAVFAPSIVSATGVWKTLIAWAAPEVADKVTLGSLSLAWWSPIEVQGLAVRDADGQPMAEVKSIRTQKTLFQLASNYQDLGTIEVTEPRGKVILRADGTNIEDFVAKLPKSKDDQAQTPIGFAVVITNGAVELDDRIAGRQWSLDNLHVDLTWPAAADQPKAGKLSAALKPVGGLPASSQLGEIGADFSWQPGAGQQPTLGAGHAQVKLTGLATEVAEGAIRRYAADLRPAGALTLDVAYQWTEDGKSSHVTLRQLTAPELTVAAPAFLQTDQLTATISAGTADVLIDSGNLDIKQLRLQSNLFEISGSGSAAMQALAAGDVLKSVGGAGGSRAEVTGQINLAELARQLPATLRMKEGTQLTDGRVQLSLVSQTVPDGLRWQGWLKTDKLQGMAAGRPIAFNQPLELDFTIGQTSRGPTIDRLAGSSSFFKLAGSGSLDGGSLTGDVDLSRLAAELGQFIHWGDTKLAGTLDAKLRWQRGQGAAWGGNADAHVRNFELAAAGLAPWRETDLAITADLRGEMGPTSLTELGVANITVSAGNDRLEASLLEVVKNPSATSEWPVRLTLVGDLANWMPRLQPFVPLGGWQMAGAINVQTSGRLSAADSQLGPTKIEIEDLAADGPNLAIREPLVKLDTAGHWETATSTLTLPSTTIATTSFALQADNVHVAAGAEKSVTGIVDFQADLAKLSAWIGAANVPRTWVVSGKPIGRMEIRYQGDTLGANWQADVENLQYVTLDQPPQNTSQTTLASSAPPQWIVRWTEPKVSLTGQAGYDPAAAKLTISRSNLIASLVSLSATGTLSDLTTRAVADLAGEVAYDLKVIEGKLKNELFARGPAEDPMKLRAIDTLNLIGQEKRQFVLKGPLVDQPQLIATASPRGGAAPVPLIPHDLSGDASLGWQGVQFVGLVAGAADCRAQLAQGIVQIGPLDIPVSEGRLTTAPRLLLTSSTPAMVVDRGPVIQNVRISPEMCNLWLKYVAPLVADATEAEGKFSLGLEAANVPLFAPKEANVAGALSIHGAQVGPGPLAKQYLSVIKQLRGFLKPQEAVNPAASAAANDSYGRWLVLPEQAVQFAVKDGIVYHDGLTMVNGEFQITTKGSVRIADQAINLVASIPVRESWFKDQKSQYTAALVGKTIEIPIDGTLSSPRLDNKVIENLGKQMASQAVTGLIDKGKEKAKGFLEKETGKVLKGLFGTPAAPSTPAAPAVPGTR